jgi:DNA polymerase elongation subunit (family B)
MSGMLFNGFDIETDASGDPFVYPDGKMSDVPPGLDPRAGAVTSVSMVGDDGTALVVDSPDERFVLQIVERCLRTTIETGAVLLTWNGTFFDLPYLRIRGLAIELGVRHPGDLGPKYGWPEWAPLVRPEARWSHRLTFEGHRVPHIDLAPLFKARALELGVSHSLKPVFEAVTGKPALSVDRTKMHELSTAERCAYSLSDSALLPELAQHLGENVLTSAVS